MVPEKRWAKGRLGQSQAALAGARDAGVGSAGSGERQLILDDEATLEVVLAGLTPQTRGFSHVRKRHVQAAKAREADLFNQRARVSRHPMPLNGYARINYDSASLAG